MTDTAARRAIDWERIEAQYRAGAMSSREIASEHGITEGAIRRRAKRDEWERDLTEKVAAKVRRDLVRSEVRRQTRTSETTARTEREEVARAARGPVAAVEEHRSLSQRGLDMSHAVLRDLQLVIDNRESFEDAIREMTAEDKSPRKFNALMRAVSLPTLAVAVRDCATASRTWIGSHRQSYGIADLDNPAPAETDADRISPSDALIAEARERIRLRNEAAANS